MKKPKLNRAWHAANRMPPGATLDQRIRWHLTHQSHCGCRPIPAQVREAIRARGLGSERPNTFDPPGPSAAG